MKRWLYFTALLIVKSLFVVCAMFSLFECFVFKIAIIKILNEIFWKYCHSLTLLYSLPSRAWFQKFECWQNYFWRSKIKNKDPCFWFTHFWIDVIQFFSNCFLFKLKKNHGWWCRNPCLQNKFCEEIKLVFINIEICKNKGQSFKLYIVQPKNYFVQYFGFD